MTTLPNLNVFNTQRTAAEH